ncbi:hypothetical protein JHK87_007346 [Glycine soja]|nr:hypothetical protein JHK87_007346 [Glycine soja]
MERCVNQSTPPAIRSSRESSVDAAIAMEPLLTNSNYVVFKGSCTKGTEAMPMEFLDEMLKKMKFDNNNKSQHRSKEHSISAYHTSDDSNKLVLVSTGSEDFVDSLAGLTPSVFVVHDSLLTLACIKEKYDRVKCWQGEIIYVPEKWAPFDAVFLYFLPALPFKLHQILESLAGKCAPGGRVIISHPKGKEVLEQQRKQYPDVVVSDLPNKTYLQSVAAAHSFDVAEFVDEPGLYLAVLICSRA